ncbi:MULTISPECIES: hypothetical protein [Giesbergeria]|uniref:Uncharacterized protein n=1 Tax=Giesbergeria sinuosa TaxID=80883 RepID=A0ABV9QCM6_9BURK
MPTTNFSIGDSVSVALRTHGAKVQKIGQVEAIIPPYGDLPDAYHGEVPALPPSSQSTYIVRVPHDTGKGKGKAFWLTGDALTLQKTCLGCGSKQDADGLLACGH